MNYLIFIILWMSYKGQGLPGDNGLLSKAQYLCPHASLCDEPPLTEDGTRNFCCKNCSCKPDCAGTGTCCFSSPETITREVRRKCLYPAISQEFHGQLSGESNIFNIVVDVMNCTSDFIIVNKPNITSLKKDNSSDDTFQSDIDKNCGECHCLMKKVQDNGIEILVVDKCVCDTPILEDGNCSCGDVKVASWGTMLPVFSRKTRLLYKNPVCAACHGVSDGIVWIPVFKCDMTRLYRLDVSMIGTDNKCSINFIEPKSIDISLLPRCVVEKDSCKDNFRIPPGLNMTDVEIIDGCGSEFYSLYNNKYKNIFCAVCRNAYDRYSDQICEDENDSKASADKISFLMTLDYLIEETANPADPFQRQNLVACSSSVPYHCREVLCPRGQIRDASGQCTYLMKYTYVNSYLITIRLIPERQEDLFGIEELVSAETVRLEHFSSPWQSNWRVTMILFEKSRLMTSGVLKNESAFIVRMHGTKPNKNQTLFMERIRFMLRKKWVLKLDSPIKLRSEIFEYIHISKHHGSNGFGPTSILGEFNDGPKWIFVYVPSRGEEMIEISRYKVLVTKLLFCQQIILDPLIDAYELRSKDKLLYLKSRKRYLFEAEFIFDSNGQHRVRVCIEDTDYVPRFVSPSTKVSINIIETIGALFTAVLLNRQLIL